MTAFQESLKAGADGIETDVHLSQDGVVVISHDETTLRCYGVPGLVSQQNYHGQMDTYRTVDEPRSSMPTLRAVLDLLSEKVYDSKWLLIDIKVDNSTAVIKGIYRTLCEINPDMKYWASRVILGIWHAKFMPYCKRHMPQLPITVSHRLALGICCSYTSTSDSTCHMQDGTSYIHLKYPPSTCKSIHCTGKKDENSSRRLKAWANPSLSGPSTMRIP